MNSLISDTFRLQSDYVNLEISKYYYDLKLKCGQFKIDFIEADINDDFDKILTAYLIKRAKMR